MSEIDCEKMIAEGWLFRCEVCGGVGDWVCDCPDGNPTTTKADAARAAAREAEGRHLSPLAPVAADPGGTPKNAAPNYGGPNDIR